MVFRVPTKIKNLKIKNVKDLIGNLSRANYYQVVFGGLSGNLYRYLKQRGVSKNFIGGDMGLLCYGGSLPGSSLASTEATNDFHGVVENFAHTRIYTPLSLEFYCDNEYRSLKMLEHWMEYVVSGNGTGNSRYALPNYNYKVKYPLDPADGYKSNATKIVKFENSFQQAIEYSFLGLYPDNLSSTRVQYGSNSELTRINCTFKYDRYIAGSIYSYDFLSQLGNNRLSNIANLAAGLAGELAGDFVEDNVQRLLNSFIN